MIDSILNMILFGFVLPIVIGFFLGLHTKSENWQNTIRIGAGFVLAGQALMTLLKKSMNTSLDTALLIGGLIIAIGIILLVRSCVIRRRILRKADKNQ